MASILKHLRSSTADKRPTASGLADGQIAINTASGTPAMFFKDNAGNIVKIGPAHIGTAAPNAIPAGSAGNSDGELWIDESLTTRGLKYYRGATFVNLTPSGTTTTVGLVELATDAETQTGTDNVRAVTPSGLQSKISDSTSTTSSTTIASSTAVKSAYDLANAALPKAGGTLTGELLISPSGSLVFEGSSDDGFETIIAVTNPTADRTITFPNVTGNVVTTGDSGTVTSTMILDGTILNADINASAAIVDTKLDTIATADKVSLSALNIDGGTDIGSALENGDLFIVDDGAGGTNRKAQAFRMAQLTYSGVTGDITVASGGTAAISAGVIVNADVNASAAIAGTKISPDFGSQNVTTTGTVTGASLSPTSSTVPSNGVYLPAANSVAISTNSVERLKIGTSEVVFNDAGNDIDFRVEGDTNANLLFVDASTDRVGIGTSSPQNQLHLVGSAASNYIRLDNSSGARTYIATEAAISAIYAQNNAGGESPLQLITGATPRIHIAAAGNVGIGVTSPDALVSLGNTADAKKFLVYQDTGNKIYYGFGIQAGEMRTFAASNGVLTFGQISTSDGTTYTERARIDTSGRLLVGTSSARSGYAGGNNFTPYLQVEGNSDGTRFYSLTNNSNANAVSAPILNLSRSRSSSIGGTTVVQNGDWLGTISFNGYDGTNPVEAVQIKAEVDGTPGTNDMPGRLVFSTTADGQSSPTERMRITNQGILNLNGQRSGFGLPMSGSGNVRVAASSAGGMSISTFDTLDYTAVQFVREVSGTAIQVGTITCTSTTTAYNTSSDYRLKENVIALDDAATRLKQIPAYRFNFIAEPDKTVDGFLAHEVQDVVPEAITGEKDAVDDDGNPIYQGIDQSKLVPLLTAALQEAIGEIESLKARVAALEAQ